MKYIYYPGCALKGTGRAYEESLISVFESLNVELEELADWNCCGATAYMSIDEMKAFSLAARNLALTEQQGDSQATTLVTPCSGCYLVLIKTQRYLQEYTEVGRVIESALRAAQLNYTRRVRVRHPLDILVNDIGVQAIAAKVQRPLEGLKVACYYGCQIARPYAAFDDAIHPMSMDNLMQALGAETVDWPLKTHCCSGSLMGTIQEIGLRLSYILLKEARKRGADVIVTTCPLCQFNLECHQGQISRQFGEKISLPVAYFTQVAGLALGISERKLGLQRLFIPVQPVLAGRPKLPLKREGGQHVRV